MTARTRIAPRIFLGIVALASGCATTRSPAEKPILPTEFQTRTGPYCVFTNSAIPADAPAIRHLAALERQVETTLGIRVPAGADPIEVYVLDGPEEFRHFLTFYFPELPPRRAFFLAQGTRRLVYTYQGGRLEEDLRHEATHALLHAAVADLPLWLDEGLAEYFEVPENRDGRNAEHLAKLPDDLANGWTPQLKRLEGLRDVRKMSPRDYRESWAWVHYLLNGPPSGKTALIAYLADLRSGGDAAPLSRRLDLADDGPRLLAHINTTRETVTADSKPNPYRDPTVRFQDPAPEPAPPKKRRGFFTRLANLFGGRDDATP